MFAKAIGNFLSTHWLIDIPSQMDKMPTHSLRHNIAAQSLRSQFLTQDLGILFLVVISPEHFRPVIIDDLRVDQRVRKVLQLMKEDLNGDLSLGCFAEKVNLSVWHLSHLFRINVGMSPIKYLRLLRMERARHLLETSYLSVKEIAHQVGLRDESHFVRDFKKAYGLSPTLYRQKGKSN